MHGGVAALCVMAGFALLNAAPDATRLARIAIVVAFARVLQSTWWSALPSNVAPGDEWRTITVAEIVGELAFVAVSRR